MKWQAYLVRPPPFVPCVLPSLPSRPLLCLSSRPAHFRPVVVGSCPLVRHDDVALWWACFGHRSRVLTRREGGGEGAKVREAREASGGGGEER